MNGKQYTVTTPNIAAGIVLNSGSETVIEDKVGTGKYLVNYKGININSGSSLTIKSGNFERKLSGNQDGGVMSTSGGVLNITGGSFIADEAWTIFLSGCSNQTVNISNAYIESGQFATFAIHNNSGNNIVNIRNSTLKNTHGTGANIHYSVSQNNSVFLCNNTLIGTKNDFSTSSSSFLGKIYYATNNTFKSGNNTPILSTNFNPINSIKTEIACAE